MNIFNENRKNQRHCKTRSIEFRSESFFLLETIYPCVYIYEFPFTEELIQLSQFPTNNSTPPPNHGAKHVRVPVFLLLFYVTNALFFFLHILGEKTVNNICGTWWKRKKLRFSTDVSVDFNIGSTDRYFKYRVEEMISVANIGGG